MYQVQYFVFLQALWWGRGDSIKSNIFQKIFNDHTFYVWLISMSDIEASYLQQKSIHLAKKIINILKSCFSCYVIQIHLQIMHVKLSVMQVWLVKSKKDQVLENKHQIKLVTYPTNLTVKIFSLFPFLHYNLLRSCVYKAISNSNKYLWSFLKEQQHI